MRQKVSTLVLVSLLAIGCGDEEKSNENNDSSEDGGRDNGGRNDAGTDDGDDSDGGDNGGGGGGDDAGNGGSGSMLDPNGCGEGTAGENMSSCSESQIKEYSDCLQDTCDAEYKSCYGANYQDGKFGGKCGDYISCTSKCDCDDVACFGECKPSKDCETCQMAIATCSQKCFSKLSCAFGDSGIDFNKTCDDLRECCETLGSDKKPACDQLLEYAPMAGGDLACSASISSFCP